MLFIIKAWQESLALLRPQSLKPFLLISLKTIVMTYQKLLISFWWLLLAYGFALVFLYQVAPWVSLLLGLVIVALTFLIVRPSVERKTYRYFLFYAVHDFTALFFLLLVPFLILTSFAAQIYALFFAFCLFFVADDDTGHFSKSLYRTVVMIVISIPFLFVVHGIFMLLWTLLYYYAQIPVVYLLLLSPLPLAILSTLYIKRLHEQSALFE